MTKHGSLAAAGFAALVALLGVGGASAQTPTPTPTSCGSDTHTFTFTNNCEYSVWLAEEGNSLTDTVAPLGGDWEIESGGSVTVCLPTAWRGRFWPRTGCEFEANYPSFAQCEDASDCGTDETCYGAICVPQCNPPNDTDAYCQGASGLNNSNATCTQVNGGSPSDKGYVCTVVPGNVCTTGDCGGLLQCFGEWATTNDGTLSAGSGGQPPATLIEPTLDSGNADNYDVSLASGYNVFTQVTIPDGNDCPTGGCEADLNASCPTSLQVTAPPGATGSISCGSGTYCETGACVNDDTCVIGCLDPCSQCTQSNPPALDCGSVLPSGATYEEMYCAKGDGTAGHPMASCNSGTPVCFFNDDCPSSSPTCTKTGLPDSVPVGAGVCTSNGIPDAKGCTTAGDACGLDIVGWPGVGYKCTEVNGNLACLPPTTPGLGSLITPPGAGADLWSGCAGVFNNDWVTAAKEAGGTRPFYIPFKKACAGAYAWQYDDQSSDYSCPDSSQYLGFQIDFCEPDGAVECSAAAIARGDPGCRPTKMRSSRRTGRSGRTPHGLAP
jgi:hypothetical protein